MTPEPHTPSSAEESRARDLYAARDRDPEWRDAWAPDNPLARFAAEGRQAGWTRILGELGDISGSRVLEVGVGSGGLLPWLVTEADVAQERCAGIDLSEDRIAAASRALPAADMRVGSAAELPWPDESFDIVVASTLFSSVLDAELRADIGADVLRVLRPGGVVLWYDMRDDFLGSRFFRRLAKPAEEWLGRAEIERLFPGCELRLRPATLFLPLARPLVRISPALAHVAERALPFLRGHWQGTIVKGGRP